MLSVAEGWQGLAQRGNRVIGPSDRKILACQKRQEVPEGQNGQGGHKDLRNGLRHLGHILKYMGATAAGDHRAVTAQDSGGGNWARSLSSWSFCSSPTVTTHPTHALHVNILRTNTTHVSTALTCTHRYMHCTQTPPHTTHAHTAPTHSHRHTFTPAVPTHHFHTSHTYTQHPQSPAPTALHPHIHMCSTPNTVHGGCASCKREQVTEHETPERIKGKKPSVSGAVVGHSDPNKGLKLLDLG